MVLITRAALDQFVAHAYACLPYEACGLIAAPADAADEICRFYPCRNAAESARVYTVDPTDHLRAERHAEADSLIIAGVVHSHTHSEPWPSPTDVAQAPDPDWHYVIVGLKREVPEVRCYRIVDGQISEEPLEVADDPG